MTATANKRKKNSRQRASVTHGYGSMKKHRGAGSRGGRGNAGSGKRGDARKPFVRVKQKRELGRYGFKNAQTVEMQSVNIYYLENSFDRLKAEKRIVEANGKVTVNLAELGFNKLLATGKPTHKYAIAVDFASESAVKKIVAAGGSVDVKYPSGSEAEDVPADVAETDDAADDSE